MKYVFVDIGCGHNSVSSDIFGTDVVGMYVEPIEQYLAVLPPGPQITKVCAAISTYNGVAELNTRLYENVRYLTADETREITNTPEKLAEYIKNTDRSGCSSLCENARDRGYTTKLTVQCMTLATLVSLYNITEIEYLKIDVEGHEEALLKQLMPMMLQGEITILKELKFECNDLSNVQKLHSMADIICTQFGFTKQFVSQGWDDDIILTKV